MRGKSAGSGKKKKREQLSREAQNVCEGNGKTTQVLGEGAT